MRRNAAECLVSLLNPDEHETQEFAFLAIPKLLTFLHGSDSFQGDVEPYFSLITKILSFRGVENVIHDMQSIMDMVVSKLCNRPVMEVCRFMSCASSTPPHLAFEALSFLIYARNIQWMGVLAILHTGQRDRTAGSSVDRIAEFSSHHCSCLPRSQH